MPLYNNLVETYANLSQFDEETEKVLSRISPDLLVCWAQSIEPTVMATIVAASKTKSKSVLVYDNWDNLSSKAVLVRHPNYIVCFGKQSLQFAEAVHSIEKSKIFAIGTSRFDVYQDARFNSDFHRRESVLIAGSSLAMEDEEILTTIEAYLDSNEVINELKKFKFIYRPHPKPQGKSPSFENWPYKHIRLDNYAQDNSDWQSQDGIRDLLCKQKLVIASPTTLIIEAILAGSEVIIPAFHIPKIKSSNRKMLSELEHLKILRDFVALKVVNTRNELIQQILRVLLANERKKEGNFDADFVVQMKPGSFSSRFNDLLLDLSKTSSDKYGDQSGVKIVD